MPRKIIDLNTVREIALALHNVDVSTANGTIALKAQGKLMACTAISRSAEPNSLMVRVDFDDRSALIADDPDVYYVTDHYLRYPAVLVRLSRIKQDALRDLLGMAHKFVTRNAKPRKRGL